jgi:transcriptional regulator with XRE-family HTH domain
VWATFINEELAARGMRPAQLALYANVHGSTVSNWRHQRSLPNRQAVHGVARCLQVPVELVAERAGMLPTRPERGISRVASDPEWRAVLARIDRLPEDEFCRLKAALSTMLRGPLGPARGGATVPRRDPARSVRT